MKNKYTTDATIVSADGKTVNLQELVEGAASYAETQVRKGFMSEAEAEDLVQDAAVNILLASAGYDTGKVKSPKSYGYIVARNRHFDTWKEKSRLCEEPLSSFEMKDDEGNSYYSSTIETWGSDEFSADREIISNETCAPVFEFISSLDVDNKEAMDMTMMGAKAEAIAQNLGCTPRAAAIRVCKLRKRVEGILQKNDTFYRIK